MLLAQIKSNYSSGAESSSDNEAADKDEKSSTKVKKENDDEEEQQGSLANYSQLFSYEPILLCIMSDDLFLSLKMMIQKTPVRMLK